MTLSIEHRVRPFQHRSVSCAGSGRRWRAFRGGTQEVARGGGTEEEAQDRRLDALALAVELHDATRHLVRAASGDGQRVLGLRAIQIQQRRDVEAYPAHREPE